MGFFMTSTSFGISLVNLFVPSVAHGFGWRTAFFNNRFAAFHWLNIGIFFYSRNVPPSIKFPKKQSTSWHDIVSLLKK